MGVEIFFKNMNKIYAKYLAENKIGYKIPEKWLNYVIELTTKKLWCQYYIREAYQVLELLKLKDLSGIKILEPGSGSGIAGCLFALMGAEVTLLDNDESAIIEAKNHAANMGIESNIRYVNADIFNIPLENEFDLVWNDGVIEHFDKPELVARKMKEMAKPNGKVIILVPGKWTLHSMFLRQIRRKFNEGYLQDRWGREKSYSQTELKRLFCSIGLKDIQTSCCNIRRALLEDIYILSFMRHYLPIEIAFFSTFFFDYIEHRLPVLSKLGFVVGAIGTV